MLFLIFFNYSFFVNMQSGFFIDFFFKKLADTIVRNIFIYTGLFFGEKYMIEVLTKKTIELFVYKVNLFIGYSLVNYFRFFTVLLTFLFYVFFILNGVIIFCF